MAEKEVEKPMGQLEDIFDDVVDLIKGVAILVLASGAIVLAYKGLNWMFSLI